MTFIFKGKGGVKGFEYVNYVRRCSSGAAMYPCYNCMGKAPTGRVCRLRPRDVLDKECVVNGILNFNNFNVACVT